jgi:hypothetical protein
MERPLKHAIMAVAGIALMSLITGGDASAGVWQWGCMGPTGRDQVAFNRGALIVVPKDTSLGALDALIRLDDLTAKFPDAAGYNADDDNSGFQRAMVFTSQDESSGKLILRQESSTRISHHQHMVCGRDEIVDLYRKVYRYDPPHEPARTIPLRCMEYVLTTTGGRPCISN